MKDQDKYREYLIGLLESVHPHLYEYEDLKIWTSLYNEVTRRVFLDSSSIELKIKEFLDIHMPFTPLEEYDPLMDNPKEELNRMLLI